MFGWLVAGGIVWLIVTFTARRRQFLREFASLLSRPELNQGNAVVALFRFSESLRGEFGGRPVAVVLKHRIEDRLGHLVIAMQTRAAADNSQLDTRTDEDLALEVRDGWRRATWMPAGFFTFPGRFDRARWRRVLERLHALACSLEARG